MIKKIIFIITIFSSLWVCVLPCTAGEYKLLNRPLLMKSTTPYAPYPKATDPSVCKAYEKNLNSFPEATHPMTCNRNINVGIKGFEEIKWNEMNKDEAIELLLPVRIKLSRDKIKLSRAKIKTEDLKRNIVKSLNDDMSSGIIKISIASFDIDNDNIKDTIVRHSYHTTKEFKACIDGELKEIPRYTQFYVFSISSDGLAFENKKTKHFNYKSGSAFNIFRYNNQTYLDTWKRDYIDPWQHKNDMSWYLKVYETDRVFSDIAKTLVCEYIYKQ